MAVHDGDIWKIHTAGAYFVGRYGTPSIHFVAQRQNMTISFDMDIETAQQLALSLGADCACGCYMHEAFAGKEVSINFNNSGYVASVGAPEFRPTYFDVEQD